MIVEKQVTLYELICDNCKEKFEGEYKSFVDEDSALLFSEGDGWEVIDDKHICPSCWSYDDEGDKYIIPQVKPE